MRGPHISSDELQVFAGDHAPEQVEFSAEDQRLFTFTMPYVYSLRDTIHVCRDFASPCRFGIVVSSPEPTEIRFFVDVPAGVTVVDAPRAESTAVICRHNWRAPSGFVSKMVVPATS